MKQIISILVFALVGMLAKHAIDNSESEKGKAVLARKSTKVYTIMGWTLITLFVASAFYFVLRYR